MSWFRVDDTLAAHPKTRAAGLAAMGLWTVSGSWSSQQLTEGFVPEWFVATWPNGKKLARALVVAGYWEPAKDGDVEGWLFHDWTDANPTAEQEKERRRKARDRQRKLRERSAAKREAALDKALEEDVSRSTSRVTYDVSNGAPSRPYPSRPDPSSSYEEEMDSVEGGSHVSSDPDEPPKCSKHKGQRREDVPDCWACGRKREQWEASRSADAVFDRAPWCGDDECHPITRQRETPFGVIRCPECHPLAEEASA